MPLFLPQYANPSPVPSDNGLLAWTSDPGMQVSSATLIGGKLHVSSILVRSAITVSKIWVALVTAGATLTAGQNWIGLYSAAGAQLASVAADSLFTGAGPFSVAITPAVLQPGLAYVMYLSNGTTMPTLLLNQNGGNAPNIGIASPNAATRGSNAGSGATVLPGSITPSSLSGDRAYWAGLS